MIGQAAEFDYAGAQACRILKEAGVNVVLVNSNPATIMTDKALADEIYLEPPTAETIKRIILKEKPDSLLAGLGGQTGLTIAMQLSKDNFLKENNVRLLGTDAEAIDRAEDRKLFKDTMNEIGQPTIPSEIANDVATALEIAEKIGYPIIVRPAFTLGGAGGGVAQNAKELEVIAKTGLDMSPISQVLIERYIFGWKEIEFETNLRALLAEYGYSLPKVINLLDPHASRRAPAVEAKVRTRKPRQVKVYKNPHSGEVVETKGGNHRALKEWKAKYGSDTVESWLTK
ncbi:hypothetical protein SDC9_153396 [bioreactor metagenome]|uniref:ATP-grasp domain-containing protein n=1 Tax=bioreactor metagenome TaxID=1076179 RepID=A0A645EXE8_9ZZZZ